MTVAVGPCLVSFFFFRSGTDHNYNITTHLVLVLVLVFLLLGTTS